MLVGGLKFAKNSSSQLKNICLSSGDRLTQSILSPASTGTTVAARRCCVSGRVDRTRGGGPPLPGDSCEPGDGLPYAGDGDTRGGGAGVTADFPRGGGGGGLGALPESEREGKVGAGEPELFRLLEADSAAEDVRLGGGGNGANGLGFVLSLTRLRGGGGGGAGVPL